jgi:rhodanese-related sulfurtransferase
LYNDLMKQIPQDKSYGLVAPAKLNEELGSATPPFMIDVREPAEIEKNGFIKGAVNLPVRNVLKNLSKLPALDKPIVIYCGSGHRGAMTMAALRWLGYTNVRNLAGGLGGWTKANLAVVTGSKPEEAKDQSKAIIADAALYKMLDGFFSTMPDDFYSVAPEKVQEALSGNAAPFVLDVRNKDEILNDGYIKGSVNIAFPDVMNSLDKLPAKDKPIVVTCGSGHRGAMSMEALRLAGYKDVRNLSGGMNAWKAKSLPMAGVVDWKVVLGDFLKALPDNYYTIKPDVLLKALGGKTAPFVVDLRDPAEIEKDGFIKGAVNIPVRNLLKSLDKLPAQDQPIVLVCGSGLRGSYALPALRLLGYKDVSSLAGGMKGWVKASLPVVKGQKPAEPAAGKAPEVDPLLKRGLDGFLSTLPDGFLGVAPADVAKELASDKKPFVLDVRTEAEAKNGIVEGSTVVAIKDLVANLSKLPADKATPIVTTCQSGHRGGMALEVLKLLGYTNVRNMSGGINAWVDAKLPLKK